MVIRFTEEEAKALGYRKDEKGNWIGGPIGKTLPPRNTRQTPERKSDQDGPAEEVSGACSKRKKKSRRGFSASDCRFDISVRVYSRREIDPDNIYSKWIVDEFVRAGILPGDSCRYVRFVIKSAELVETKEEERTVVEIREFLNEGNG